MTSSWKRRVTKIPPFGVSLTVISLSSCQFSYYILLKVTKNCVEGIRKENNSLSSANFTKLGLDRSSFSPCKNIGPPPKLRLYSLSSQQSINIPREVCLPWEEIGICLFILWSCGDYSFGIVTGLGWVVHRTCTVSHTHYNHWDRGIKQINNEFLLFPSFKV